MILFSKIFKRIDKLFDEAIDKVVPEPKIEVKEKKKSYNKYNDTTTNYSRSTVNGKIKIELTVNGRKVDPESEEGKKILENMNVQLDKGMESLDKGMEALDRGMEAMDRAFEKMDEIFDKF